MLARFCISNQGGLKSWNEWQITKKVIFLILVNR
jgi:hypothetical protein